ncbi:serine/threonine-protein kinase [Nonomuraea soli]|uniref:Serine/threonine protein kinase n=1 Tax=Nonomuraea soli TaxID=1032476 RepID=A0A7W0HUG5_9ACTN|nr:serine/threonine-protein kinase [Nonomuraea soli]MBA2896153.1 serine/threonine protein kinase [Nonomuraea soli]
MPSYTPRRPEDPERLGGYELRGRLGEGGQGVVYVGADERGELVAIKWLRPHLSGDTVAAERFVREASVAQRVAPFCTARCLSTGMQDGRPYIVSEYIDGPTLHQVVTQQGPRSGPALHRLAIGTVTALAAIHQAGIVHRDFSPANVLLASEGPRVIDFGIARALDMTSITSSPVGTPSYMSPEQIMAHPAGPPSDMFAWASTMVYAATGRGPFPGDSVPAIIHQVLNNEPDLSGLSGTLRELVGACLSKDPARRPTAEQVIMALVGQPMQLSEAASVASGQGPLPGAPMVPQHHSWPPSGTGQPSPQQAPQSWPPSGGGPQAPHTWPPAGSGAQAPHTWPPAGGGRPAPQSWPPAGSGPQAQQAWPGAEGGGQPAQQAWPSPSGGAQQQWHQPGHQEQAWASPGATAAGNAPWSVPSVPERRSRGPVVAGIAASLAVVATVVAVVVAVQSNRGTPTPSPSPMAAGSQATPSPSETTQATPSPSPTPQRISTTGLVTVDLPDTGVKIYEHPSDAVRLTTYTVRDSVSKNAIYYPRESLTGGFTRRGDDWEALLSPDGRWEASRGKQYTQNNRDSVKITDKASGESFVVETAKKPQSGYLEIWSKDSGKLLVNIGKPVKDGWQSTGFAIVDIESRTAQVATLRESSLRDIRYGFDGEQDGVVALHPDTDTQALRFFDRSGQRVRRVPNVGSSVAGFLFSPSGRLFQTTCPGLGSSDHCVYDAATGGEVERFASACTGDSWWYDEQHLVCWAGLSGGGSEIRVIDFTGEKVRVLAELSKTDDNVSVFYTFR